MKKIILSAICVCLAVIGYAQGIAFKNLSFQEALTEARQQNKGIYIDVYTSWCGPCKQMAREVFPQKEVGEYFNAHFISLQLDAEKQAEHGFFKNFKATAYPTSVWLDADGNVVGVEVGLLDAGSLIRKAREAAGGELQRKHKQYTRQWENGDRSRDLLRVYVFGTLQKLYPEKVKPYFEDYLATLGPEEMKDPVNCRLLIRFLGRNADGIILDYFVKYYDQIEKNVGYVQLNELLYRTFVRSANMAIINGNDSLYRSQLDFLRSSGLPGKQMYLDIIGFETLLNKKKYKEGFEKMIAVLKEYGEKNPYLYRNFCYSLVSSEYMADARIKKDQKKELIGLAAKTFELNPDTETITYLAAAYAKAGNYEKAYETELAAQFYPKDVLPGIVIKDKLKRPVKIVTGLADDESVKKMKAFIRSKEEKR